MEIRGLHIKIPGTVRFWALLAVALLALSIFAEVAEEVLEGRGANATYEDLHQTDKAVYDFLIQFKSDRLTQTAIDITALGSVAVLVLFTLVLFIFLVAVKDKIGLLHLSIAMAGAGAWPVLLKNLFGRERPDLALHLVKVGDLSFPSGHSFGAAAAYFTFAFFAARYISKISLEVIAYVAACSVILLVGLSRVYLGVHYASDVIAGICAGVAWSSLVTGGLYYCYESSKSSTC